MHFSNRVNFTNIGARMHLNKMSNRFLRFKENYNNKLRRQHVVGFMFTIYMCVDNIFQYDDKKHKL